MLFIYFTENKIANTCDWIYDIKENVWEKSVKNEKIKYYDYIKQKKSILSNKDINKYGFFIIVNSTIPIKINMSIVLIDEINNNKDIRNQIVGKKCGAYKRDTF